MTRPDPADPRLLFVVSRDFGELSNAIYLLKHQDFTSQTTVLLPSRLYDANKDHLPGRVDSYSSYGDLVQAIDAADPEIVFFFSGCLLVHESAISLAELESLVARLERRGCRVVSSDPFLGLLSQPDYAEVLGPAGEPLIQSGQVLSGAVHFYPFLSAAFIRSSATTCVTASNRKLFSSDDRPSDVSTTAVVQSMGIDVERPFWLLVLGTVDYRRQRSMWGDKAASELLVRQVADAAAASGQAVLLGPPECVQEVGDRLYGDPSVVLADYCPHDVFTWLVMEADHMFYWNIFSNSIFIRLPLERPTFFFDIGHLAIWPQLHRLGVINYYQGWSPTCLDPLSEISLPVLRLVDHFSQPHFRRLRDRFISAPSPREMIDQILAIG